MMKYSSVTCRTKEYVKINLEDWMDVLTPAKRNIKTRKDMKQNRVMRSILTENRKLGLVAHED